MSNNVNLYKLAGILDSGSAGQILTSDGAGNFSFATLEIPPSGLDSASAIALQTPQDFAYASLTGTPNVLDSSNVSTLITTAVDALVAGAPAALDTLNELAIALNDDSNAIAAITSTLALKLNIADVVAQDFAYTSLTGTPNVLDSAAVVAIASALGGVDSSAITSMIDSDYILSRAALTYAGSASVTDTKFIADSAQTIFTGLSFNDQFVQVHLNGVLLIDSDDYVKSGNDTITTTYGLNIGDQLVVSDFTAFFAAPGLDSSGVISIIDSAYVIALSPPQDFAYASLTGVPSSNNAIALNQAGTLAVTTGTVRWYAPAALTVNSIVARLGTAADATVTAVAKKNGSTAATTSITAGQTAATNNTGFSMVTGDYLTLDITTIGSTNKGADLNVQFLYAFN